MPSWYDRNLTPMKLGTVPHIVLIHGFDRRHLAPGKWIRIKEGEGCKWNRVLVEAIRDDGTVVASR
jgi:hypothetical protein